MEEKFTKTEMGSARRASLEGNSNYKYEEGIVNNEEGFRGPPWGKEPSMKIVCEDLGVDYNQFINALKEDKSDINMANELGVKKEVVESLRKRFYDMEAISGNTGQD